MGPAGPAIIGRPLGPTMMLTGVGPWGPAITGMLAPLGPGAMLTTTPPGRGGLDGHRLSGKDDRTGVGTGAEAKVGTEDRTRVGAGVVEGTGTAEGRVMGSTETGAGGAGAQLGRMTGPETEI